MSEFQVEPRPENGPDNRTQPSARKIPALGKRAAILAASCALLVGVGAAGQASESITRTASTEAQSTPAQSDLSLEKSEIQSNPAEAPAPAEIAVEPQAAEPAPVVAVNDPAGAQAYAAGQLGSYGWSADQMPCLVTLWTKESDWTTTATNASSGAYGIVQSLPAEKMASAGADYLTNYRTQINWGLNYIQERYQSPCGALNFHYANNWY